jgi:hypothetical protein
MVMDINDLIPLALIYEIKVSLIMYSILSNMDIKRLKKQGSPSDLLIDVSFHSLEFRFSCLLRVSIHFKHFFLS